MNANTKEANLGATGIRENVIRIREKIEEDQKPEVYELLDKAIARLKKATETELDEPNYISFPVSKYLEEFGSSAKNRTARMQLAYYLRGNKNIVTRLGEANDRVVPDNMKPFAYSYVSEEKKKSMGLDAYCMKNLTDEMKEYIQERTKKANAESDIYDLLLVCDYLTVHDAHKKWIKLMGLNMSAALGQPIMRTKKALDDLITARVLVTGQVKRDTRGKATICHLAYSMDDYSELNNQLLSGKAADEFKEKEASKVVVSPKMIMNYMDSEDLMAEESKAYGIMQNLDKKGLGLLQVHDSEQPAPATGLSEKDIRCLKYIVSMVESLSNGNEKKEVESEKTIARLRESLFHIQKENTDLRENLIKAESEVNKLNQRLKAQEKYNQAYSAEARKSMNQLIASVSSTTENFTRIPHKRVTPDDIAEFKSNIIRAATDAQNRLRDFKYEP